MRDVTMCAPGDKSISHRALFLASLARGACRLDHLLTAEDGRSAARVLRRVGVEVSPLRIDRTVVVGGRRGRYVAPTGTLHCGNSGTTARMLLGVLASQQFSARITGDASLRRRPMARVTRPLAEMGARFPLGDASLPLVIEGGALRSIDYRSQVSSAQVKTSLLLAGLAAGVPVTIRQPHPSRDHTERLCLALGLEVRVRAGTVRLMPGPVRPFEMRVPGDPSSGAFMIGAAVIADTVRVRLPGMSVNPSRTGAFRVLARMGATLAIAPEGEEMGEPVGEIIAESGPVAGTTVDAAEIPSLIDEVPMLAVLASRAEGETVFREVGELRVKESNRLELLAANLRTVGARAEVSGNDLAIEGRDYRPAGRVDTAGDHRMAMAFSLLRLVPGSRVTLSESSSVSVSYPQFFEHLERIRRAARHRH